MTKKELSEKAKISTSRITQLMASMTENIDYIVSTRGDHGTRVLFSSSGVDKVMNRNRQGGRVKVERVKKARGRPRKNLSTIEEGGEV